METLFRDLRFALRRLRSRRGFTLVAVLSLALGIGANTAIFSIVNAVLLTRLPYTDPDRLIEVYLRIEGFSAAPWSYPDFRELREATAPVFAELGGSQLTIAARDMGDHVETLPAELVSGNFFPMVGLQPRLGRLISAEDDVARGQHPVVVLAYDYWASAFGADPSVVGRELRLSGRAYQVVGVAPESFEGSLRGLAPSLYIPMSMINQVNPTSSDQLEQRGNQSFFVKGRLGSHATFAQAEAAVAAFAKRQKALYPTEWSGVSSVRLERASDVIINPMIDRVMVPAAGMLMVVVGLVLLIACANLASFLLAQARDRRKEIALRLALGAHRGMLIRQLLAESVLLAFAGGAAGVGLARFLLRVLMNADLPLPLPITIDLGVDGRVLTFAFLVSLVSGILFGLAPALQFTKSDLVSTLRDEATGGGRPRRFGLRNVLVGGQVAVSLVLLIVAGLMLRSFQARQHVDPGFGMRPAALLDVAIPADRYDAEAARELLRRLSERLTAIPGVTAVGATSNLHLNQLSTQTIPLTVDGLQLPAGQPGFNVDAAAVDSGYFNAVGIAIVSGRNFGPGDLPDGARVALVNQAMAERFWPGQDPVGRTFRRVDDGEEYSVIGVVRNAKIRSLGEAPRPFIYGSLTQRRSSTPTLIVQTQASAEQTLMQALVAAREIDPDLPLFQTRTMSRHLAMVLLPARLGALVFTAFALLALTLALMGVYGVVSYAVARRTREVGIRMALGEDTTSVVRTLMSSGMKLVLIGTAAGLALALAMTQLLRGLLFGVGQADPVTFVLVPLILVGVALLATWVPARRATRADPLRALRSE